MIETLTLNREQAVNMLEADVDSLTEDKKDAISMMLKCIYKTHTTTRIWIERITELNCQTP